MNGNHLRGAAEACMRPHRPLELDNLNDNEGTK